MLRLYLLILLTSTTGFLCNAQIAEDSESHLVRMHYSFCDALQNGDSLKALNDFVNLLEEYDKSKIGELVINKGILLCTDLKSRISDLAIKRKVDSIMKDMEVTGFKTQRNLYDNKCPDFTIADLAPSIKSGQVSIFKLLSENIKADSTMLQSELLEKILVYFVIDPDGNLIETKVLKGSEIIGNQAIDILKTTSGAWQAGLCNCEPISVEIYLPIHINLNSSY